MNAAANGWFRWHHARKARAEEDVGEEWNGFMFCPLEDTCMEEPHSVDVAGQQISGWSGFG